MGGCRDGEGAFAQFAGSGCEICGGKDNAGLRGRRGELEFEFIAGVAGETEAIRRGARGFEGEFGCEKTSFGGQIVDGHCGAKEVLGNAAVAEMFAAIFEVKRARKILRVLERLIFGIAKEE